MDSDDPSTTILPPLLLGTIYLSQRKYLSLFCVQVDSHPPLQLIKNNMLLSVKMWSILAAIVDDKLENLGLNVVIKIKLPAINVKMVSSEALVVSSNCCQRMILLLVTVMLAAVFSQSWQDKIQCPAVGSLLEQVHFLLHS